MTEIDSRPIMESNQALQAALELSMLNLNNTTYSTTSPDPPFGLFDDSPLLGSKKSASSQNITQCVAVPSSEHVAEIVGRQGKGKHIPCGLHKVYLLWISYVRVLQGRDVLLMNEHC